MIRGVFDADPPHPAPRVSVTVDLHGVGGVKHPSDPIDFLIDTGATRTLLHPADAINRLGFKLPRLQNATGWSWQEGMQGAGGNGAVCFVVACRYFFLHDDGSVLPIDGQIRIAMATNYNNSYPSLLGRDLLEHFKLEVDSKSGLILLDHQG